MAKKKLIIPRNKEEKEFLLLFAANLRKLRAKTGLTQEELAHVLGFSRSYYAEIETGKRNISLLNIAKLIKFFKVDANKLVEQPERHK